MSDPNHIKKKIRTASRTDSQHRIKVGQLVEEYVKDCGLTKHKGIIKLEGETGHIFTAQYLRESLETSKLYIELVNIGVPFSLSPEHFTAVQVTGLNKKERISILIKANDYNLSVAETILLADDTLKEKQKTKKPPKAVGEKDLQKTLLKAISESSAFASQDIEEEDYIPNLISAATKELTAHFLKQIMLQNWLSPEEVKALAEDIQPYVVKNDGDNEDNGKEVAA